MLQHINLVDGQSCIRTKEEVDADLFEYVKETLRGERLPLNDGYYLSAGYLQIVGSDLMYGLYTPHSNPFERWIGFEFKDQNRLLLSAALIHNPEHLELARQRLYGGFLGGMPHRPPLLKEYSSCELFPALLTFHISSWNLPSDGFTRTDELFEATPSIAYAIISLFEEF